MLSLILFTFLKVQQGNRFCPFNTLTNICVVLLIPGISCLPHLCWPLRCTRRVGPRLACIRYRPNSQTCSNLNNSDIHICGNILYSSNAFMSTSSPILHSLGWDWETGWTALFLPGTKANFSHWRTAMWWGYSFLGITHYLMILILKFSSLMGSGFKMDKYDGMWKGEDKCEKKDEVSWEDRLQEGRRRRRWTEDNGR